MEKELFFNSKNELEEFIYDNKLKTKIVQSSDKYAFIKTPNYKDYEKMFYGKVRTCFASNKNYWKSYHDGQSVQIDFLSFDRTIDKKYIYICCDVHNIKVEKKDIINGDLKVTGKFLILDYKYNHFNGSFTANISKFKDYKLINVSSFIHNDPGYINAYNMIKYFSKEIRENIVDKMIEMSLRNLKF